MANAEPHDLDKYDAGATSAQEAGTGVVPGCEENPSNNGYFGGRGPRRWFIGSGIASFILLISNSRGLLESDGPTGSSFLRWLLLACFIALFMTGPPLSWKKSETFRVVLAVAFFALSLCFFAFDHDVVSGTWMWTFVAVFIGSQGHPRRFVFSALGLLFAAAVVLNLSVGNSIADAFSQAVSIGSLGLMMFAFSRQINTISELRRTQNELAELAVATERNRVARDMHDILGHSLTVIAVKAELAGRLLEVAPEKAAAEITDVEDLARGALEDVRATVSGYRGVNVISELANARTALVAAGVDPDLPGAADQVPAKYRELFGWVLREAVTNVIRHADASHCKVTMGPDFIQIEDDGVGPGGRFTGAGASAGSDVTGGAESDTNSGGNGLKGIGERAAAVGAALQVGRSELGGFRVRLSL